MNYPHFFLGSGKLRIWYILFYLLGLPLYLLGLFLLSKIKPGEGPQGGEFILSILAIGYLVLGFFSMINTGIYINATKRYFWGTFLFLGFQILFWMIGYTLGNNYVLLFFFFTASLLLAVFLNLCALWQLQHKKHSPHKTT